MMGVHGSRVEGVSGRGLEPGSGASSPVPVTHDEAYPEDTAGGGGRAASPRGFLRVSLACGQGLHAPNTSL